MDRLEYDLQTKKRVMKNAVIFNQDTKTYLTAKEIFQEGDEKIIAKECTVTTCDPQESMWRITSREVLYEYDHFSTAKGQLSKSKEYLYSIRRIFSGPLLIVEKWPYHPY